MKKLILLILFLTAARAAALPSKYDLREHNRVADYSPAALGACVSNYMTQFTSAIPNLSGYSLSGDEFTAAAILSKTRGFGDMRLRDVYFMSRFMPFDSYFIDNYTRKNLIMTHGAIYAGIYLDSEKFDQYRQHITYFNNSHERNTNHNILLIGWDDDFPLFYFTPRASQNGAWLVQDSHKYFWIPYEQIIKGGAAFIVEKFNSNMQYYYYDENGYNNAANYSWAANIFRIREDLENLSEIAFYTPRNNTSWDVYIYECGSLFPDSPVSGILKAHISGSMNLAGYHTVNLPEELSLWQGEYISVVLKLGRSIMPISSNEKINAGESYFSHDGINWTDGKNSGSNSCIKAFTVIRK